MFYEFILEIIMKKFIISSISAVIVLLVTSVFITKADVAHPSDFPSGAWNNRVDRGPSGSTTLGKWQQKMAGYNDDNSLNWMNFKCIAGGGECAAGDWVTVWQLSSISEPPSPPEPGPWTSYYFDHCPIYDAVSDMYY